MVKLKGPGLANRAAGQLAGELIFSNWKGRAYLKKHRRPRQPRAPGQVAMRAMITWLSSQWSKLDPAHQATWVQLAARTHIAPVNAYQAYNLRRWRNHKYPSLTYPATETGTNTWVSGMAAAGGVRCAYLTIEVTQPKDGWGLILMRGPTAEFPRAWHRLITVHDATAPAVIRYCDAPLAAGTYHYRWCTATENGGGPGGTGTYPATVTD